MTKTGEWNTCFIAHPAKDGLNHQSVKTHLLEVGALAFVAIKSKPTFRSLLTTILFESTTKV